MPHALGLLREGLLHTLSHPVDPLDNWVLRARPQVVLWARPWIECLDLEYDRPRQHFETNWHLFGFLLPERARVAQVVEQIISEAEMLTPPLVRCTLFALPRKPLDDQVIRWASRLVLDQIIGEEAQVGRFHEDAVHPEARSDRDPVGVVALRSFQEAQRRHHPVRAQKHVVLGEQKVLATACRRPH
eukprot:CAMPEP_0182539884 /NCGR_PEP_ID=MMETSP1323-20130603/26154_1 /TAXON_ID=236787 /ORGANISM="Florenciella parvula, Strain RCC1693" /LENGTH=186 /DNA_ID=CAMNT_0024750493 /DNA_START=268 /DNA_END=825 /DNA_ORIENTATION=-